MVILRQQCECAARTASCQGLHAPMHASRCGVPPLPPLRSHAVSIGAHPTVQAVGRGGRCPHRGRRRRPAVGSGLVRGWDVATRPVCCCHAASDSDRPPLREPVGACPQRRCLQNRAPSERASNKSESAAMGAARCVTRWGCGGLGGGPCCVKHTRGFHATSKAATAGCPRVAHPAASSSTQCVGEPATPPTCVLLFWRIRERGCVCERTL